MSNRKQREQNRRTAHELSKKVNPESVCKNCGEFGSHFIPSGFGFDGEYACALMLRIRPRQIGE